MRSVCLCSGSIRKKAARRRGAVVRGARRQQVYFARPPSSEMISASVRTFRNSIVLALVFSAIPLPFEADMTGTSLYAWWALVTVLYLIACDFFQVARLAAFVQFWRLYHPGNPAG